ncbi:MAG: DUF805 domain-containing protein [Rhodobacteraceae bacterium]|nr:DUF805 domain-containing protein [Paracoccaceae bacterium]
MGFVQSIKVCLSKYVVFSGRATRSEYWWFVLFVILCNIIFSILDGAVFGTNPETGEGTGIFNPLFQVAIFLPMLAAGWRRLHDSGRPGWYLLLPMALGFATMIALLSGVAVFAVLEGGVEDPEALRGPAAFLGATGMIMVSVLQLVLTVMMIWWLTRPSQDGDNAYGPPAV